MIKGRTIILRTIREKDLEAFYTLSNNVRDMGPFWPVDLTSESQLNKQYLSGDLWSENRGIMLITTLKGEIIGQILYFKGVWYLPGYEINYNIYKKEDREKGYAIEALDLFSNYLFELWPIQRLELSVSLGNDTEKEVALKAGYKFEGVKRQCFFQGGRYHDSELFSLIRGEEKPFREMLAK